MITGSKARLFFISLIFLLAAQAHLLAQETWITARILNTEQEVDLGYTILKISAYELVAIEISARLKMPSYAFIKLGKEMGAKFTFGTNNIDSKLGNLTYCLEAIEACGLETADMWVPGW